MDILAQRKKKVGPHLVGDIGMTPTEQTESCLFSSYFTPNPVGTHGAQWMEFSTSVRLKNGRVDLKTSPEPQPTSGREVSFFFFILTEQYTFNYMAAHNLDPKREASVNSKKRKEKKLTGGSIDCLSVPVDLH